MSFLEQKEEDKNENSITLKIRMPNGKYISRFFQKDQFVKDLYDFVFVNFENNENKGFTLVKNFPKTVYDNLYLTIEQTGLEDMDVLNVVFS
jgi:hypothetical protein